MQGTMSRWQLRFCTICIDGDGHGSCRLPVDDECALRSHSDMIEQELLGSGGAAERVGQLRERVCSACGRRDPDGTCWKSNRLECAFDRFLPVMMETQAGHPAGSA